MRLSAYDTFRLYLAIKNHFSRRSYDYFKYNGKMNITQESFLSRRDKHQFAKLSRLYDENEMRDFLVANLLHDESVWVGFLLQDEAKDIYNDYLKRKQALSYTFANELDKMIDKAGDIKALFKPKPNELLPVISYHYAGLAGLETLALLDHFVGYLDKYEDEYKDDYLWGKVRMKCKKLYPFIEFDKEKIKNILKDRMNAHIYT